MNVFLAGFGREDYTPDKQIRMNSVKYSAETVQKAHITPLAKSTCRHSETIANRPTAL